MVSDIPQSDAAKKASSAADELGAVLRALPDLYFVLDADGRFVDFSAGRSADLYRSPEEFLGKHFSEVLPPEVAAATSAAIDRTHANDEVVTYDYSLTMGGEIQWFEVRVAPFGAQTVALARNVTERRLAVEKLRLQEERVRQAEKLEALGLVAGSIAHDFNNFLTMIGTSVAVAERSLNDPRTARAMLTEAQETVRRASELTRLLLAFARRESMGTDVLDLDAVIDEMEFILKGLAHPPVTYVRERSPAPLPLRAVRAQLEQVLLNVVVNAVDAMPAGGTITLRTSPGEGRRAARLVISDTGVGMSPDVAARALEPFFSTKPEGKGTGLGLATVESVVRAAGGRVAIESAPNSGTTVLIEIPLAD